MSPTKKIILLPLKQMRVSDVFELEGMTTSSFARKWDQKWNEPTNEVNLRLIEMKICLYMLISYEKTITFFDEKVITSHSYQQFTLKWGKVKVKVFENCTGVSCGIGKSFQKSLKMNLFCSKFILNWCLDVLWTLNNKYIHLMLLTML